MPILFIVLLFIVWLTYELRKGSRKATENSKTFWEKEHEALTTPRQSTADISFITIPDDIIPDEILDADSSLLNEINELSAKLKEMSSIKIADLSAYTNTELRLRYGAPNFKMLSEADINFSYLSGTVSALLSDLIEAGMSDDAEKLYNFAVSVGIETRTVREAGTKIKAH